FFNRFTEAANLPLAHDVPRPLPRTRLELKELIEDVKARTPRIPLPQLSDEDRQSLGARADSYETRLRFHYLGGDVNATPAGRGAGRTGRDETSARGGRNSR